MCVYIFLPYPPPPLHTHTAFFLLLLTDKLLESRGPLQVDLIKPKGASLGISLSGALYLGQPMYISKIKEAGIAER